eukprot:scaffold240983_cov30-Tisochrysis_lutea.AAC.3
MASGGRRSNDAASGAASKAERQMTTLPRSSCPLAGRTVRTSLGNAACVRGGAGQKQAVLGMRLRGRSVSAPTTSAPGHLQ